jgi:hypothetical protein
MSAQTLGQPSSMSISIFSYRSLHDLLVIKLQRHEKAFRTKAVMIREPERKKEQKKRRIVSKLSPWS